MHFEKEHIYHIYNQGNNRQRIFFERRNYFFFLKKMRTHLLPHGDLIAYCLMPNHFHWMMVVRKDTRGATKSRTPSMTPSNINKDIGILLASYTRAINKEQKRSGSLFRQKTKTECLTCNKGLTPSFFNTRYGTIINVPRQEKQYPQACFDYIHNNPVEAGLVKRAEHWEFSSSRVYYENRNCSLINKKASKEFGIIFDLKKSDGYVKPNPPHHD